MRNYRQEVRDFVAGLIVGTVTAFLVVAILLAVAVWFAAPSADRAPICEVCGKASDDSD